MSEILGGAGCSDGGPTIHQLKVTISRIRPPVWRRIQLPSCTTLEQLHHLLLVALGWEGRNLHAFYCGRAKIISNPLICGVWRQELPESALVCDVAPQVGGHFCYEYDFGDGWEHEIVVEQVLPASEGAPVPICLKGKRAAPPEDCGGPEAYQRLLELCADPGAAGAAELALIEGWDPEACDLEQINRELARVFGAAG